MKKLLWILLLAPVIQGADIPLQDRPKIAHIVERWLAAQNQGRFEDYSALYEPHFKGIRMTGNKRIEMRRADWLKDRSGMFQKPMKVSVEDAVVLYESTADTQIRFVQRWVSGHYGDVGRKILRIRLSSGKIDQEELLESVPEPVPSGLLEIAVPESASVEKLTDVLTDMVAKRFPAPMEFSGSLLKPLADKHILLGVCSLTEALPVIAAFRRAVPLRVTSAPPTAKTDCPRNGRNSADEPGEWNWPRVVENKTSRMTLMAWPYSGQQLGDFARQYETQFYVGILRDTKGAIVSVQTTTSESDFAQLESLSASGTKTTAVETYIDNPCTGADTHPFSRIEQTITYTAAGTALTFQKTDKEIESGECSDSEAQLYQRPEGD